MPNALELDVDMASASLPYGAAMIGMGLGGILMGWLSDRHGPFLPATVGAICISVGCYWISLTESFQTIIFVYALLLGGLGNAALAAPLFANAMLWFEKRRGVASAVVGSGNALGGAIWPPVLYWWMTEYGFESCYQNFSLFALVVMLPSCLVLRSPTPDQEDAADSVSLKEGQDTNLNFRPNMIVALLCLAVVGCCTAMSMPLVHLPNHVQARGFTLANGAILLSVLMTSSVIARIAWGFLCDRLGGLKTLLITSSMQALGLAGIAQADSLTALYGVGILFGVGFGGILPCYPVILREYLDPKHLGLRVGLIVLFGSFGMALGPEIAGRTYASIGSYTPGFFIGVAANMLNLAIIIVVIRFGIQSIRRPAFV